MPDGDWVVAGRRGGPRGLAIKMKKLDVPQSGLQGTTVSYKTRYGVITRQHVVPRDPRTEVQVSRRAAFGRARYLWGKLSEEQRAEWNRSASGSSTRPRLGQSGPLSGYLLFIKINCNLAAIGLDMVLDPPRAPDFEPNPIGKLTITNAGGDVGIKLSVTGKPGQCIVVSASRPRSAGTTREDHLTIIGLLPNPVRGMSDIKDLYVAKFPSLPAGSRIFIRTVQQVDGWQGVPKLTSATIPAA